MAGWSAMFLSPFIEFDLIVRGLDLAFMRAICLMSFVLIEADKNKSKKAKKQEKMQHLI